MSEHLTVVTDTGLLNTETLRLADLHLQNLLYTPLDSRHNRLARLARHATGARVATISFLDGEREWFKAALGWDVRELPYSHSLTASLRAQLPFVIPDTMADLRCADHPLIAAGPRFRAAAAYPLRDRFDQLIGTVAVYDTRPGRLSASTPEIINDIGQLAQRELFVSDLCAAQSELIGKLGVARRQAMLDDLTRLWNRRAGVELLRKMVADAAVQRASIGVGVIDIDRFKAVNDAHGHPAGDLVLRKVAAAIVDSLRPGDVVARMGGEEFLIVAEGVSESQFTELLERVCAKVAQTAFHARGTELEITLSGGGVVSPCGYPGKADELIDHADSELFRAKHAGRNRVHVLTLR